MVKSLTPRHTYSSLVKLQNGQQQGLPTSASTPRTVHESGLGPAAFVQVCEVAVSEAVVSQVVGVAQTLQDGIHEALKKEKSHR